MTTAVLTDGDGAGGGSSHPDVAEQKDFCFRHWQNAATSVGEGRCIQMSPGSEEERNNSASSRNHGETVWSQTTTSLLEEPPLASPILGSEQGWLDPGVASAARSGCSPRLSRMCQMLFAGKGAMLVSRELLCPGTGLELNLGSCSAAPSPVARGPCWPTVRAEQPGSHPSGPSAEICLWASSPSLQPGSVHMDKTEFLSCLCQLYLHGSSRIG